MQTIFTDVVLEAAKGRYERDVRYRDQQQVRRRELVELAVEQDRAQTRTGRVKWAEWLPYLRANLSLNQYQMSDHISDVVGFYVEPYRISNAIKLYRLKKQSG